MQNKLKPMHMDNIFSETELDKMRISRLDHFTSINSDMSHDNDSNMKGTMV